MLFLTPPQNADDIRSFCRRFNEGLRVEYKSTFDNNVRSKTAKMLSSFANSLGGVAIIGVNAANGTPQEPIDGFEVPGEELPLVIEQICLQGINPPLLPKITQIPSDVDGRCFLIIEVDESLEAPHAIENSKRVYIRTGNAANPYDLAEIDLITELLTRRRKLVDRRTEMVNLQRNRTERLLRPAGELNVQVSIGPTYPRRPLVDREGVWQFLTRQLYRGGHFLPSQSLRRTNDGVLGRSDGMVGDLTQHGFVFWAAIAEMHREETQDRTVAFQYWNFGSVLRAMLKALVCAARFYRATLYRGNVQIDVKLSNCDSAPMPFIPWDHFNLDDFACVEMSVIAGELVSAETLSENFLEVLQRLSAQFCWPFWQSFEEFPAQFLTQYVQQTVQRMGRL